MPKDIRKRIVRNMEAAEQEAQNPTPPQEESESFGPPQASLKNDVEVYRREVYIVRATNRLDAEEIMRTVISSEDQIRSVIQEKSDFVFTIHSFVAREFGNG